MLCCQQLNLMSQYVKILFQVRNYLPSISAAIGGFTPQRYIWRVSIALHSAPRFMIACMYYNFFTSYQISYKPTLYKFFSGLASFLHILENFALVMLTYVSSTENYSKSTCCELIKLRISTFFYSLTLSLQCCLVWSMVSE